MAGREGLKIAAMKHKWIGSVVAPSLPSEALREIVATVLPGVELGQLQPLSGGFRNHNFRVQTAAGDQVLRVYQTLDRVAYKERRLAEVLQGKISTPAYVSLTEVGSRTVALRTFVPGVPLHEVLLDPGQATFELGARLGEVLARIHALRFDRHGDLDQNLAVCEPYSVQGEGLKHHVREQASGAMVRERVGETLARGVVGVWQEFWRELSIWTNDPSLTHGDFGPTNLLQLPDGSVSVLDWEFGSSCSPAFDFGNLLRPPLEDAEAFQAGLASAYTRSGGYLPSEWQRLALLSDSVAWLQMVARQDCHELVIADARARLARTVEVFSH
jgi:aminoglycoside phosphotransferase (APT) family kinase protein